MRTLVHDSFSYTRASLKSAAAAGDLAGGRPCLATDHGRRQPRIWAGSGCSWRSNRGEEGNCSFDKERGATWASANADWRVLTWIVWLTGREPEADGPRGGRLAGGNVSFAGTEGGLLGVRPDHIRAGLTPIDPDSAEFLRPPGAGNWAAVRTSLTRQYPRSLCGAGTALMPTAPAPAARLDRWFPSRLLLLQENA